MRCRQAVLWSSPLAGDGGRQRPAPVFRFHQCIMWACTWADYDPALISLGAGFGRAAVDLLWNGGIGTFVKSSGESHAEAGDRTHDGIRVDGRDLGCKAVGEGGNLG